MAGDRTIETKLVSCLTCSIQQSLETQNPNIEDIIWENSYNLHLVIEEEEAFLHSKQNPRHIMVEGFDFGFKVNGF